MKAFLAVLLVAGSLNAAVMPASQARAGMSKGLTPIYDRIQNQIQFATSNGLHYVAVDMDGTTFKEQNRIMKELQGLGYTVTLTADHHVFGWNALNGGLLIKW